MPSSPGTGSPTTSTKSPGSVPQVLPLYTPSQAQFQTQIGNTTPPTQQTLVYAPDVRIIIRHNGLQYEVSNDLVRGTVIRRENAASTLLFTCHNKNLRYTNAYLNQPLFYRMDAVTCYMKRAGTWVQVFTGYLDSVPYLDLYPGLVNFKATCTLKRLLCNWWNPGLPESAAIMNQLSNTAQNVSGDGTPSKYNDSGLGSLLRSLLEKVGGWNPLNIHIENFPEGFLDLLQNQMKEQQANQKQADAFRHLLEGDISTPAPGPMASYNPGAGMPGQYGSGATFYVSEIVAATDQLGMGPNTTDIKMASGIQQAATGGEGSRDQATRTAFAGVQNTAQAYNTAQRNSDAAIIAVATAMVESGLRNLANPGVAESMNYNNDGVGSDHDSCGLFQQRPSAGWGSVSEEMNPRQAATMFLQRLNGYDWRNSDPGAVAWNVQRAGDQAGYEAKIDAAIPEATKMVQAARQSSSSAASSTTSTALSTPLGQMASSTAPALTNNGGVPANIANATFNDVSTGQRPGANKPIPDSEGAINWMMTQLGKPYSYGATGPAAYDCSSLMQAGFRAIGVEIGRDTHAQAARGQRIAPSQIRRGDTLQCEGGEHTMMWCGDGTIIEAATEGVPIHRVPAYVQPGQAYGIFRFCDNGGPDPTAPFNPPETVGPGNPPYTGAQTTAGGAGASGGQGSTEPIAQNLFSYLFTPDQFMPDLALMYGAATPQKDFLDAQPLIQMVQSVCGAGLRNFASAPNGDFIAYYPDYFGMDGTPAVFILEDIELKNFSMNFSDDALTTHVYVNGAITPLGETDQEMGWLKTMGYATVENTTLYQRMRLVAPGDLENLTGEALMKRFGVRPLQVTYSNIWADELQFLLAVRIFMEKWAAQYQNAVSFTFLPDLFPGMRVQMAKHNVQVYVTEVTHDFDFEQGFNTDAVVCAPSNPLVRNLWASGGSANSVIPPAVPSANNTGGATPSITNVLPLTPSTIPTIVPPSTGGV